VTRPAVLAGVQIATVGAILGCCLVWAARHPWRLDVTPDRRFTLSTHTRGVLAGLPAPVTATYFYNAHDQVTRRDAEALLRFYADASPRFRARSLDLDRPRRGPGLALRPATVVASNMRPADPRRRRTRSFTAALAPAGGAPAVAYGAGAARAPRRRRGRGSPARALEAEGFTTRPLPGAAAIPRRGAVLLAGTTRELREREVEALAGYVARGGALVVLGDPPTPRSVRELLGRFGLEPGDDVVVDEQGRLIGADGLTARVAYLNEALVPAGLEVSALLPLGDGVVDPRRAVTPAVIRGSADVDRRALDGRPRLPHRHRPRGAAAGGRSRARRRMVWSATSSSPPTPHRPFGKRDLLAAVATLAVRGAADAARRPAPPLPPFAAQRAPGRRGGSWRWACCPGLLRGRRLAWRRNDMSAWPRGPAGRAGRARST
jgi:hypothetical protein